MNDVRIESSEARESAESQGTEQQALDDATYQPRAHVEQSSDYQQAEAIQNSLAVVVDNAVSSAEQTGATPLPIPRPEDEGVVGGQPAVRGDLDQAALSSSDTGGDEATPINLPGPQAVPVEELRSQSGRIGTDPLTGKSIGDEGEGHPHESSDQDQSVQALDTGESESVKGQMPRIRDDLSNITSSDSDVDEGGAATPIPLPGKTGIAGVEAGNTGKAGSQQIIPDASPQQAEDLTSKGARGILEREVEPGVGIDLNQNIGPAQNLGPGTGPGIQGGGGTTNTGGLLGGQGSSSGGPPINMGTVPGGGGKGSDEPGAPSGVDGKAWGKLQRSLDVQSMSQGGSTTIKDEDTGITFMLGSDGIWKRQELDDEVAPQGDPINGMSPMPYTGNSGGSKPEPQIVGGPDIESGRFSPIISIGGENVGGGGSTDPDDLDDSGKWYGGLFGSIDRPNNPDDPDYYTPNVFEKVEKTKRRS